jgi:hypothetical protein
MPTKESFIESIEKELLTGKEAQSAGNSGKARVCARRAAGQAITWFLSRHPHPDWGADALSQLKHLKDDPNVSQECRDAAARLSARVSEDFTYPFSSDPLEDAGIIIRTLMSSNVG